VADFLSIEVTGNRELLDDLAAAVRRIQRPADLMDRLGARLKANIEERFDRKVDPTGQRWEPLAASTREKYDREDTKASGPRRGQVVRQGTLLERTGLMRSSLDSNRGPDYVDVFMNRLTDTSAKGGNWQIPLLHETGTRRMPRRGIFFADPDSGTLGDEDEAMLSEEITAYLDEVFGT
jgi:phage gpG-like protein